MYSLRLVESQLDGLSVRLRFAFATACSERCFRDMQAYEQEFAGDPSLHEGILRIALDICWKHLLAQTISFDEETRSLHEQVGELIPSAEDENESDVDVLVVRVAYAISESLMILKDEPNSAKLASLAGSEVIYVRGTIYSNGDEIEELEYGWQEQLINLLKTLESSPITLDSIDTLRDYNVGQLIEWE